MYVSVSPVSGQLEPALKAAHQHSLSNLTFEVAGHSDLRNLVVPIVDYLFDSLGSLIRLFAHFYIFIYERILR